MGVFPLLGSLCFNWHNQFVARIGFRARAALTTAVYRKSLKLSSSARSTTSVGVIVNIMSTDAQKLKDVTPLLNGVWSSPLTIAAALYLLYQQIGASTFVGVGFLIVLFPLQGMVFMKIFKYRFAMTRLADQRMKLTNDVLSGVRVVKMYAWEWAYAARITAVRKQELALLKRIAMIVAVGFLFVLLVAPFIMNILVFVTFSKTGGELLASTVFTTVALFQLIQFPFSFLPMVIQSILDCKISLKRLQTFLELGELGDHESQRALEDFAAEVEQAEADRYVSLPWIKSQHITTVNFMHNSEFPLVAAGICSRRYDTSQGGCAC